MNMIVSEQNARAAEPYVSVPVVAELLGVPASWVYERTARGEIPYRRVGRYLRFRISEIEAWVDEQQREGVRG